jgi:TonB family protein
MYKIFIAAVMVVISAITTPATPQTKPAATPSGTGYRAALSAWLESHRDYPASARARGEEGRAVLRFRVDRSGRVLNYALVGSTGYADLDASINAMMRGATLPPFPADMTASDVEVSVTVRFTLDETIRKVDARREVFNPDAGCAGACGPMDSSQKPPDMSISQCIEKYLSTSGSEETLLNTCQDHTTDTRYRDPNPQSTNNSCGTTFTEPGLKKCPNSK